MRAPPTEFVAVVVPAHNEQDTIAACLTGIRVAASHPHLAAVRTELVVVLDACDDLTAQRAAETLPVSGLPRRVPAVATAATPSDRGGMAARLVTVGVRNVGQARALGAAAAFEAVGPVDPETVWLATTDADSVVPPDWLAHQLRLRADGADGCAGMIIVDSWNEHPPATQAEYERQYWPCGRMDFAHRHVHGTNLGVSMAAYLHAGGFADVASGEDHALWRALKAAGRNLVATPIAAVTTSGRRHGRSPAGFADLLVSLNSIPA